MSEATRIVAIGGGHGLASSLRAIRHLTDDVTAIVSVADNGGSTGRLRQENSIPAPGDLRKCLAALSDGDSLLARSLEHRFEGGDLDGHALGNLLIAAMAQESDLISALEELGRLIGAKGLALPATVSPVTLVGRTKDGSTVQGQVQVMGTEGLVAVSTEPSTALAAPESLKAIENADLLVLGPGSLFTSVLAALVVPGIREAVEESNAKKIYVCNLAPQTGETSGFDVAAHVNVLFDHQIYPDVVLYDPAHIGDFSETVNKPDGSKLESVAGTLADPCKAVHNPERLSHGLKQCM